MCKSFDCFVYRISGNNKTSMLRLEELDFMPLCDIVGKEAVSAIHRAKTQHCKQQLANITCLNIRGDLYPQQLPHSCPNNGKNNLAELVHFKLSLCCIKIKRVSFGSLVSLRFVRI